MNITASMVKELRERTGAGMMECKKALQNANGDMEAAVVEMRKSGQAKAAKRAGKIAAEGVIVIKLSDDCSTAFMVELNSETDFVARDENFKAFAKAIALCGLQNEVAERDALLTLPINNGDLTVEQARQELVTKLGENIHVRRVALLRSGGMVGSYQHGDRIGVLVALDKKEPTLGKDLAMHIAATKPQAVDKKGLSQELLTQERDIYLAQAKESGKPEAIAQKMVEGRIAKFIKENCLVSQPFVKDPDTTIANLLQKHTVAINEFIRFEVGEGIEKEEKDFAEEVRAQVQGS